MILGSGGRGEGVYNGYLKEEYDFNPYWPPL
jgi:hypothetical protein